MPAAVGYSRPPPGLATRTRILSRFRWKRRSGPEVQADGQSMLMLSSYDYLGLIGDPRIDTAAIEAIRKYGTGTGGARLLTGTTDQHQRMEQDLADFQRDGNGDHL